MKVIITKFNFIYKEQRHNEINWFDFIVDLNIELVQRLRTKVINKFWPQFIYTHVYRNYNIR